MRALFFLFLWNPFNDSVDPRFFRETRGTTEEWYFLKVDNLLENVLHPTTLCLLCCSKVSPGVGSQRSQPRVVYPNALDHNGEAEKNSAQHNTAWAAVLAGWRPRQAGNLLRYPRDSVCFRDLKLLVSPINLEVFSRFGAMQVAAM